MPGGHGEKCSKNITTVIGVLRGFPFGNISCPGPGGNAMLILKHIIKHRCLKKMVHFQ